jgi:hypothetical protein
MTKTEAAALEFRDHALKILRRHGRYVPLGDTKFLMWIGEGFDLWLRTPFQKWDTDEVAAQALAANVGVLPKQAKYLVAQPGLKLPKVLPYCIDLSQSRKVFSLEWSDDGRFHIINFKHGVWEAEFLVLTP